MNGGIFVVAYLLVGLGITLTTAPKEASMLARAAMIPGWLVFFGVAGLILAFRRGRDL